VEEKRHLNETTAGRPGKFRFNIVPFIREPLDCLSDPAVHEVCAQKSAQIAWTEGVVCNWLGYTIDEDPSSMIALFPADKKAREFGLEKFDPMVEATPALNVRMTTKSRAKENTLTWKAFPGGFVKFVGSNSPSNLKSTSARRLIVEEPDDCNLNIKGQGDSIALIEERGKTFDDSKLLVGGTPTIKGASSIAARMELTDQRRWYVPCHECGHAAPLAWEQVKYDQDPAQQHPVFGNWLPETARYCCPGCGVLWTNAEKNRNVRRADALQRQGMTGVGWVPTAPFRGKAGFYFNELMSPFEKSALSNLVVKYLVARHEQEADGDIRKMIVFWNAALGLPWEYTSKTADPERLADRVEDYPEWWVPWGGLILTVGIDVQHDRLAVVVLAWGEGEESWLVWAGEFYGNVLEDGVWDELDRTVVFRSYRHVSGAELNISALSVDVSDGQTGDAGYKWARRANRRFGVARSMPIKGARNPDAELFRKPAMLDVDAAHKGAKYGLRVYMVGVGRAKDLILGDDEQGGRINLQDSPTATGRGPGRMHWYRGVRADYFEQVTAEVKAPARDPRSGRNRLKKVWLLKSGKANHFLDGNVYALHAARALRIDTYTQQHWKEIRTRILQGQLFGPARDAAPAIPENAESETTPSESRISPRAAERDDDPASHLDDKAARGAYGATPAQPAPVKPAGPSQAVAQRRKRMRHPGVTS